MEDKKRICENCIFFGRQKEQGFCHHNLPSPLIGPNKLGGASIQFFDVAVAADRIGCEYWTPSKEE